MTPNREVPTPIQPPTPPSPTQPSQSPPTPPQAVPTYQKKSINWGHNMTSLPPITPYHGALGTTQDEFINSVLSHHEILKREKRTGYVEMGLVRNLGAYCKGDETGKVS